MERISEARLLPLLGGQSLDRFKIEIVVEMEVCEILSVDEEIKHVETLPADLETSLDPINGGLLEELRLLQRLH
jgi:hypothetical protein